jgi:hypothetical protein
MTVCREGEGEVLNRKKQTGEGGKRESTRGGKIGNMAYSRVEN